MISEHAVRFNSLLAMREITLDRAGYIGFELDMTPAEIDRAVTVLDECWWCFKPVEPYFEGDYLELGFCPDCQQYRETDWMAA